MLSYAFLDSKVSHILGGSQNPSSRAISMFMSCLPDPTGKTPQDKGMLAGGIMQATACGGLSSADHSCCVYGRQRDPKSCWSPPFLLLRAVETSLPLRHVQMACGDTHEPVTPSLLVSDHFSTATTGLPPPVSVHNSSVNPFSLLQSLSS